MKKFIALALSLVMALGLSVVAWGAEATAATAEELVAKVAAAADGDTVKVTANVTLNDSTGDVVADGKKVTITAADGVVITTTGADALTAKNGGTLVLDSSVKVNASERGVIWAEGGHVIINGANITSSAARVAACAYNGGTITVETGSVITVTSDSVEANAVAAIGTNSKVTINGGELKGVKTVAFASNGGEVIVNNGSLTRTDTNYTALVASKTYGPNGKVTVNNGTVDGVKAHEDSTSTAVINGGNITAPVGTADGASLSVTGGTFTTADVSDYVTTGYSTTTDVNGNTVVVSNSAITPASSAKGAYYTTDMTGLSVYPSCDLNAFNYTLEHYVSGSANAKTFDQKAIWATNKTNGAKTIAVVGVIASPASANLAFVSGSSVTYLNTNVSAWTATATAVTTVDVDDAEKCGEVFATGDVGVYKDANGTVYVESAAGTRFNVNNKLVLLKQANKLEVTVAGLKTLTPAADTVYTVKHTYAADTKTVAGKTEISKVYCTECKNSFSFVTGAVADAVKKFGAGNYVIETLAGETVYIAASGAYVGTTGTTTDTVKSAETFDAGIAMYVGMSVLAATGSAVVLKKKD